MNFQGRLLDSDTRTIDVKEPYEIRHWSKKFKVTPEKLRTAIQKVGTVARDVQRYLKESG